jgi:hypothetical protein
VSNTLDDQEARYRAVIDRRASDAYYPPVAIERTEGYVMAICANGHRWGSTRPEDGCHQCREAHRFRLKGRTECEVDGCDNLVTCRDEMWDTGMRKCELHWTRDGGYVAGPICLDEEVTVLGQYNPRNRWNGWLMPSIDAWSVEQVLAALNSDHDYYLDYGYDHEWLEDGSLKLIERQWLQEDPDNYQPEILRPDEDGLYSLGAGSWVWSEDTENDEEE